MKLKIDYTITPVIFYRFVCKDPTIKNSYVGHTTNFVNRKHNHKRLCNNSNSKEYNRLIYTTIRNNGGWYNWTMIEIDSQIVLNKKEAIKKEQEYINEFSNNMNTKNSYSDYDTKKEQQKLYYELNKESISERKKLNYELNKEKIAERRKLYYELNKKTIAERQKLYYEKNKEKK